MTPPETPDCNRATPASFAAPPCWADRPLAHKTGIQVVLGLLVASGGMCPKCGFGTRVTSKNWARCKKCGERVKRVKMSDIKIVQGPPNNQTLATASKPRPTP